MDWDNIEKLLEKYFDAETTVDEEMLLKKYFSQPDIPDHLKQYTPLFVYLKTANNEQAQKSVQLPKRNWKNWLSVAAGLLLFFSVFNMLEKQKREKEQALAAYNETVRALDMIASNLNKGNQAIYELKTFSKTKNKIFNPVNK